MSSGAILFNSFFFTETKLFFFCGKNISELREKVFRQCCQNCFLRVEKKTLGYLIETLFKTNNSVKYLCPFFCSLEVKFEQGCQIISISVQEKFLIIFSGRILKIRFFRTLRTKFLDLNFNFY